MASLEKRNGKIRIKFRFGGKQYSRSLKTESEQKANLAKGQIERNLELVALGLIQVPAGCDIFNFFLTGTISEEKSKIGKDAPQKISNMSFARLFKMYFHSFLKESIEENSFGMLQTHRNNLERIIGGRTRVDEFRTGDIQTYVNKRSQEPGRRGPIKATTIRKEVTTLSTILRWAVANGLLEVAPSKKGIRYPKGKEKPPFQTWQEIERQIANGNLAANQVADLWECLFLSTTQVSEFLRFVKDNARHGFIYPAIVFAAHTGARRSEIARSQVSDVDFESGMISIRELKRVRGMRSTRRVPMSPFLASTLRVWLDDHPGGSSTFCLPQDVCRSKKERQVGSPITKNELHNHFSQTTRGSKWSVLKGWHVLRHSFCSNCAAAGVEQRLINEWVGHQTDEMVRRYRHLFPDRQQQAIQAVFGSNESEAETMSE